ADKPPAYYDKRQAIFEAIVVRQPDEPLLDAIHELLGADARTHQRVIVVVEFDGSRITVEVKDGGGKVVNRFALDHPAGQQAAATNEERRSNVMQLGEHLAAILDNP